MNMDLAREFAELTSQKRALDDQLSDVKEKLNELSPILLEEMVLSGVEKLPMIIGEDRITLYTKTLITARPKEGCTKHDVMKALKRGGLSKLVAESYNSNSLSAWARERLGEGQALPPSIERVLDINEHTQVQGRKSAARTETQSSKASKTLRK